jgi:hypothetical protein
MHLPSAPVIGGRVRVRGWMVRLVVFALLGAGAAVEVHGRGPLRAVCDVAEDHLTDRARDSSPLEALGADGILDCSPL